MWKFNTGQNGKRMIEIRYKGNLEASDIAGRSIAEARNLYKTDFRIPDKAAAFLNGNKVSANKENAIFLDDEDVLMFKAPGRSRVAYMVGALLLALAVTGGVFASGFMNSTTTVYGTVAESDFASVTANTSSPPSWTARGLQRNQTGSGTLFDIDTLTTGYTGDIAVTVSLANTDDLVKVYRSLNLSIEVRDSANNLLDINEDGISDSNDFTLLTLENSRIIFNISQGTTDVYTIYLKHGYFICNAGQSGWTSGDAAPMVYCEVAQK